MLPKQALIDNQGAMIWQECEGSRRMDILGKNPLLKLEPNRQTLTCFARGCLNVRAVLTA